MKQDQLIDTDQKVASILKEMEQGFRIDVNVLIDLKRSLDKTLLSLQKRIDGLFGRRVEVNSNKNLGSLLFEHLRLPSLRRTPTGDFSASVEVLERLMACCFNAHSILQPVTEFKRIQPLAKSVKTIFRKLDLHGRIHPEFNQSGCPTGRAYSYIQNIQREVRKSLIPDSEENVFIELDWSQQELRILGALSQEPVLLDCFTNKEDLHKKVISEMFHKPVSEVTDEERKAGKTINYALIFGQEAPGLAWKLNIPLKKAQELIDQYFSSLPMIQKFKYESREKFSNTGYAETVFGRKTKLNLIGPKRERELRRGFNHLMQGTAADILRLTLIRLSEALTGTEAKLKFCAHDSIYLEIKKEDSEEVAKLTRSVMEIDFMGVHLPVTIKTYHDFSMGEGNA